MACIFHFGQSWWRKIQSESSLREAYMVQMIKALGKWLKQFFTLLFLACHKVNEAFTELISIFINDDVGYLFTDYILLYYIEDECLFPPLQNCGQKTHQ